MYPGSRYPGSKYLGSRYPGSRYPGSRYLGRTMETGIVVSRAHSILGSDPSNLFVISSIHLSEDVFF